MSSFVDNLSYFLAECRNDILVEACGNKEYVDSKTRCIEIYEILNDSIPSECSELLTDFADARLLQLL